VSGRGYFLKILGIGERVGRGVLSTAKAIPTPLKALIYKGLAQKLAQKATLEGCISRRRGRIHITP